MKNKVDWNQILPFGIFFFFISFGISSAVLMARLPDELRSGIIPGTYKMLEPMEARIKSLEENKINNQRFDALMKYLELKFESKKDKAGYHKYFSVSPNSKIKNLSF